MLKKTDALTALAIVSRRECVMSLSLSAALDMMRWVAAMLVVLNHLRNVFFIDYQLVAYPSLWDNFFYFFTGLGHQAVMVFFVLSGYLVGGRAWERMRQGTFHIKDYAIDRFSRIYSVFFVAVFVGVGMDWVGMNIFGLEAIYVNPSLHGINVLKDDAVSRMDWQIITGNLLMLQTIIVPVPGSNSPLWSLANECWYYLLFPILWGAWYRRHGRARFLLPVVGLGLIYWLPVTITQYFVIWLLGSAVMMVRYFSLPLWSACVLFAVGLLISRFQFISNSLLSDLWVALGVALLIQSMQRHPFRMVGAKLHKGLADFSYSLYLCHLPLLLLITAGLSKLLVSPIRAQPSFGSYVQLLAVMVLIYLFSYMLAWMVEFRLKNVRNFLKSRL